MSDLPDVTGNNLPAKFIEEESWLRQPGETNAAYHAFCLYRDYGGDRSIKKALVRSNTPMSRSGIWQAWIRSISNYDKIYLSAQTDSRINLLRLEDFATNRLLTRTNVFGISHFNEFLPGYMSNQSK